MRTFFSDNSIASIVWGSLWIGSHYKLFIYSKLLKTQYRVLSHIIALQVGCIVSINQIAVGLFREGVHWE